MNKTIAGLDKAKEILLSLENSIEECRQDWIEMRTLNPNFEQLSDEAWEKRFSRSWLHGATEVRECNALEEWLYASISSSDFAISKAKISYQAWGDFIREKGTYADFSMEDLLGPEPMEQLDMYIYRLVRHVQKNGWGTKKNKGALKSFLSYLRKSKPSEEVAFIEHIFPKKGKLHFNSLIRLIKPQVYPIPEEVAGEITKTLAEGVIRGRANAQLKKAEALALCWLCVISSRLRLPITLESIHAISINSIVLEKGISYIKMPYLFGPLKVQISDRIAEYLQAINDIPSPLPSKNIFSSDLHDLRRPLRSAIKKAKPPLELGKITFLTFMSQPHHFGKNSYPGRSFIRKSQTVP